MSRWERVNCASLAAILIALLLLAGHSLPRTEPASSPAAQQPAAISASDWRPSEPEPSGVRGLTVGELLQDAWASYDRLPSMQPAPADQFTMVPEYAASHDGMPSTYPSTFFTIQSSNFPGVFHVFSMVATQRA